MSWTALTLLTTPGEYRLGLWDNRRQAVIAVSLVSRHLRVGDRWVIDDADEHSLIAVASGTVDFSAAGQFSWTLVLADVIRPGGPPGGG